MADDSFTMNDDEQTLPDDRQSLVDDKQTLKDDRKYNHLAPDCFKEKLRFIYHFYNSKKC
jgi:hypothetical protein